MRFPSPRSIMSLLLVLLFVSCNTYAATVLTMQDAVMLALRYNPAVQNAEIKRVLDKFNLRVAQNQFELNYALNGSTNYTHATVSGNNSQFTNYQVTPSVSYNTPWGAQISASNTNQISQQTGSGAFYNPGVTFSVTQPLLRGFGPQVTLAPLHNAYDTETINQLALKNTVMAIVTQVISQYLQVVQSQNALTLQEDSLLSFKKTSNQYKALADAGRQAPADLLQFKADVANQELAVSQEKVAVQQAKLNLLSLLGLNPITIFSASSNTELPPAPTYSLAQSIELALHNNVNYQSALLNLNILQRNLIIAKDQQRWQLDLSASQSYGYGVGGNPNANLVSLVNGQNKVSQVGVVVSVPIHDVNRQLQEVSSKNALDQSMVSIKAQKLQIISDVTNAYLTLQSQKQQITQAQDTINLAAENLKIANIKLKFGRTTPFEVSSLQNALTSAQIGLINTQENYYNSLANFDFLLGLTLKRWNIQVVC